MKTSATQANLAVVEPTLTQAKSSAHSPCTQAVAACRLAAIAAIAEPIALVAQAYAAEAYRQFSIAQAAAADDNKDRKQVATAERWTIAAQTR